MIATSSVCSDQRLCKNNHYLGRINDTYTAFKPYDRYRKSEIDDAYMDYKDCWWYDYEQENWRRVTEFHDLALIT
jgi:hypothetical protein